MKIYLLLLLAGISFIKGFGAEERRVLSLHTMTFLSRTPGDALKKIAEYNSNRGMSGHFWYIVVQNFDIPDPEVHGVFGDVISRNGDDLRNAYTNGWFVPIKVHDASKALVLQNRHWVVALREYGKPRTLYFVNCIDDKVDVALFEGPFWIKMNTDDLKKVSLIVEKTNKRLLKIYASSIKDNLKTTHKQTNNDTFDAKTGK